MTVPSATQIRLTIESFPGDTNSAKRAAIFAEWKELENSIKTGARTISLPGLSGSIYGDDLKDRRDLLMACLEYLDGLIGDDPTIYAAEPMGHTFNFSCRPVIF